MKAQIVKKNRGREMVLAPAEGSRLKAHEVEIENRYAGASLTEVMSEKGKYVLAPRMPYVPGYEFLGEIARIGPKAKRFCVGDIVCGVLPHGGCYSSLLVADERYLVPVGVTDKMPEIAASLINYFTAMELLSPLLRSKRSGNVLIRGVAGGVGLAVVEIAKANNISVWGTCSVAKRALAEKRGAVFLDRTKKLSEQTSLMPSGGFDIVMDAFGIDSFIESSKYCSKKGTFAAYGFFGKHRPVVDAALGAAFVLVKKINVRGIRTRLISVPMAVLLGPKRYRTKLGEIVDNIKSGAYEIGPLETYPLSKVFEAHRKIEASKIVGKVILDCRI